MWTQDAELSKAASVSIASLFPDHKVSNGIDSCVENRRNIPGGGGLTVNLRLLSGRTRDEFATLVSAQLTRS